MTWVTAILGVLQALPKLIELIGEAISIGKKANAKKQLEKVKDAIDNGTSKDIEEALGSDTAGKPTKHKLDGVQYRKPGKR